MRLRFALLSCLFLSCLFLTACNTTRSDMPAFDAKAAEVINQQGKGKIEGHAFFRSNSGTVYYAAGEWVRLIPATAYAQARFEQIYGNGRFNKPSLFAPAATADPDYVRMMRSTKAESTGRFTFENVAPGNYFVATQITWVPDGEIVAKGGTIYETVTVTGKETDPIKVVVSGK